MACSQSYKQDSGEKHSTSSAKSTRAVLIDNEEDQCPCQRMMRAREFKLSGTTILIALYCD